MSLNSENSKRRHRSPTTKAGLEDVIAYQNPSVVDRFLKLYDIERTEAECLFAETRKFIWACASSPHPLGPITIIDAMWHNFILFTADYSHFCERFFGQFIHHNPADDDSREEANHAAIEHGFTNDFERQLNSLFDLLGADTLFTWYVEYPFRYDEQFYDKCCKPPRVRQPTLTSPLIQLHSISSKQRVKMECN